jgi:hypothetical protein
MKHCVFGCVAWMIFALMPVAAQDYPTKSVRIAVGSAARHADD